MTSQIYIVHDFTNIYRTRLHKFRSYMTLQIYIVHDFTNFLSNMTSQIYIVYDFTKVYVYEFTNLYRT